MALCAHVHAAMHNFLEKPGMILAFKPDHKCTSHMVFEWFFGMIIAFKPTSAPSVNGNPRISVTYWFSAGEIKHLQTDRTKWKNSPFGSLKKPNKTNNIKKFWQKWKKRKNPLDNLCTRWHTIIRRSENGQKEQKIKKWETRNARKLTGSKELRIPEQRHERRNGQSTGWRCNAAWIISQSQAWINAECSNI